MKHPDNNTRAHKVTALALVLTATLSTQAFSNELQRCYTACRVEASRAIEGCNDNLRSTYRDLNRERQETLNGYAEQSRRMAQENLARSNPFANSAPSGGSWQQVFQQAADQWAEGQQLKNAYRSAKRDYRSAFSTADSDAKYCAQRVRNEQQRCQALCY